MHLFEKHNLTVASENLAVPEVRTDGDDMELQEEDEEEIRYDDVAIPEVHIQDMEHPKEKSST